jgi:DNA-binding transcriptional regulator LsrR (DeoR family)
VQIGYAARRFYQDGASRVDIADELEVNRFKVARLLKKATTLGIVKIEITLPQGIDSKLSSELADAFGLKRAIAVATPNQATKTIHDVLGRVVISLLQEVVRDGDLIGLSAGRTLQAGLRYLGTLPRADVVSLCGVANLNAEYAVNAIQRIADAAGGTAWPIYAPYVLGDSQTADALRADPRIKDAMEKFDRISLGVVVIGSWTPPESKFYESVSEHGLVDRLLERGVVGEIAACLFDADGRIIHDIDDRTLSVSADQLRRIPQTIGLAGGERKTTAVLGALRTGMINSLVTDTAMARRLLKAKT